MARDGKAATRRGANLERRVGRVEFMNGALVRLRHPVTQVVDGRRRDVTDIDVLTVDFDARLRAHVGVVECKSTRGQSGEQDRLLWLRGLRQFVDADTGLLVRESVSAAGRDMARNLGLELVADSELGSREAVLAHVPDRFASLAGPQHDAARKESGAQLKQLGDIPSGLVAFLRHDALLTQPHRVLGAIVTLDEATREGTVLPDPLGATIAADALMALVVSAMRTGHLTDTLGVARARSDLEVGIGTGDPRDRQMLKMAEMADQLLRTELASVHRAYREAGAAPLERGVPSVREAITNAPVWLDRFMDLAERLRRRSRVGRSLPQTLDLALFDALPGGKAYRSEAFDHLFSREHRQAAVLAVDCLHAAVPALAGRLDGLADIAFDRAPTPGLSPSQTSRAGTQGTDSPRAAAESDPQDVLPGTEKIEH